jgi:hypothetical protein
MANLFHHFWLFMIMFCCGVAISLLGLSLQRESHVFPDKDAVYIVLTSHH